MLLGTFPMDASMVTKTAVKFVMSSYVTDALTSLLLRGAPISSPIPL